MTPDTSQWRLESAYAHFDTLPGSGLAWECLRRNHEYQKDFASTLQKTGDLQRVHQRMMRRWGLRFRGQTESRLDASGCLLDRPEP